MGNFAPQVDCKKEKRKKKKTNKPNKSRTNILRNSADKNTELASGLLEKKWPQLEAAILHSVFSNPGRTHVAFVRAFVKSLFFFFYFFFFSFLFFFLFFFFFSFFFYSKFHIAWEKLWNLDEQVQWADILLLQDFMAQKESNLFFLVSQAIWNLLYFFFLFFSCVFFFFAHSKNFNKIS